MSGMYIFQRHAQHQWHRSQPKLPMARGRRLLWRAVMVEQNPDGAAIIIVISVVSVIIIVIIIIVIIIAFSEPFPTACYLCTRKQTRAVQHRFFARCCGRKQTRAVQHRAFAG